MAYYERFNRVDSAVELLGPWNHENTILELMGALSLDPNTVADRISQTELDRLNRKAAWFDAILDNAPISIYLKTPDGTFSWVNQKFAETFGAPAEAFIGKTAGGHLSGAASDLANDHDRRVLETGKPEAREEEHFGRIFRVLKCPVFDADDNVVALVGFDTDITELRRVEKDLRQQAAKLEEIVTARTADLQRSEARLSKAAEIAGIGYWVWDEIEDKAIYCSDELAKMHGVASGDELTTMLSSHAADLEWVHPDDRERFEQAERTVRETKRGVEFEHRLLNAVGEIRHVHVIEEPVLDEHGKIIRSNGTVQDITERKRAENALRESEARFRTLVEHAPEAITMLDVDTGLYLDANPMAEALHGLPRDELIGKIGPADLSPDFQPDGRSSSEAAPVYLNRALAGEFPRFEWTHLSADGQETLCEVSLARLPDPHRNLIRASITDITERKRVEEALQESEARLSKAAEMAKIGYWIWDEIEDKAIFCSEELAEINGVASGAELTAMLNSNEKDIESAHPDDRDRIAKVVQESADEQRGYDIEFRMIRLDGEVRHLREILEPVIDDEGNLVRSNGIIQDITDRKHAEEQLLQAQKMEAVGQLTAGVAHDFNNMLAVILGNAELLEDELGKDNPLLAAVHRATARAAELTRHLLAFSRKQVLKPEIINANSLIADITGLLRRTLEAHIDIETVTAAGLWNCEVDPAQLENALVNLALNARDVMPHGGKLTIETANARLDDYAAAQAEVTPGQYVMLAITDTGTGMPPEVREHVFEPFFTTKEAGEGTGLGLSMVYGFVKQSGGHVTITSEQGEGTTIKLYLPRSAETEAVEWKPATGAAPVGRGETVLVVEDDPEVRKLAAALLDSLGYQVMEASTGPAALEQLESTSRISLLLTDVVLPGGMNGRELATEVERRAPRIQVLYMSGYTEDAIVHHGRLDAGAELLHKPFRRVDLARAVRKVLDRRSK